MTRQELWWWPALALELNSIYGARYGARRSRGSVRSVWRSVWRFVLCWGCGVWLWSATSAVQAGPWSQELGRFYVKLAAGIFLAQGYRGAEGMLIQDGLYTGITSTLYAEMGLGYGFQLQAGLPYTVATNAFKDGSQFTQGSFPDFQFALQWMFPLPPPVVMAFRIGVKIPPYDVHTYIDKYPDVGTRFPIHGDGQIDVTLWYSVGGNIPRTPLYGFLELGYQFRTEAFVGRTPNRLFLDSLLVHAQLGWTFWRRMILQLNVRTMFALGEDLYSQSFVTAGLAFYLPLWRGLALEAAFDPTLWAKNAAQGYAFTLGLSYRH